MSRALAIFCAVWLAVAGVRAQSPTPRIWQGAYTTAQAERGKSAYDTSCVRCHGADLLGTTAPALKGARFTESWGGQSASRLFEKIRDTMPPLFGTFVSDDAKLDIVAYVLQANAFPSGKVELAVADLNALQIVPKGGDARVQNFALVQVVGCLAKEGSGWRLTQTGDPVATTEDTPTAELLAQAAAKPLGSGDYRLLSAAPFDPAAQQGQKVEARGLIYDEPGNARLTVTSLKSVGACR